MTRVAGISFVLLVALSACDGLGRPIVGTKPILDGGDDERCEVTPACAPVRAADPSSFIVSAEERTPPVRADCDADGVADAVDNCPGVPNADQDASACADANASCGRLHEGVANLAGADLRGCRLDEPLAAPAGLTLQGADLSCASLSIVAPDTAQAHTLDVSGANLGGATLAFDSAFAAVIVDLGRSELRGSFVRASGAVRLRARESVLANATLVLEPGGAAHDPSPALELTASDVDGSTIYEAPAPWPGRVRVERSSVRATTFDVSVLDLVASAVVGSNLGATDLFALDVELTASAVSVRYGAFSMCDLRDVIFARCEDLHLTGGVLEDVDVPLCEPDRLRIVEAAIVGARIAGGLHLVESDLGASILGGGPASVVHTEGADLDAVTICDLGAAAFRGGELRCVKCAADAFMGGTSVCLGGARVVERGCPAIELAPECP